MVRRRIVLEGRQHYADGASWRGTGEESDIRVLPLTPALAATLRAQADRALNGDGSCSLEAMTTSCFASEKLRGQPLGAAARHDARAAHKFVAVDGAGDFVGCVTAAPSR